MPGIEPGTTALSEQCSTTELHARYFCKEHVIVSRKEEIAKQKRSIKKCVSITENAP
jgi:hypothetical protein